MSSGIDTLSHSESQVLSASNLPSEGRADGWRKLALLSGLFVAAGMFFPVLGSWPSGSPARLWWIGLEQWSNPSVSVADQFDYFCVNVASYLFGTLMAAVAAARLLGAHRVAQICSTCIASLLIFVGAGLLWVACTDYLSNGPWTSVLAGSLAAVSTLAYVLFAVRLGPKGFVCHEFAGGLAAVIWFCYSCLFAGISTAVYLSLAASILLVVSTIAEARLDLGRSWLKTEWLLLTCLLDEQKTKQQVTLS